MNVIAECKSYDDLHLALRERYQEMRITNEAIDDISGCQTGYSAKVLGPNPTKRLGPISWSLLEVLGVKLLVVDDPETRTAMQSRYEPKSGALRGYETRWESAQAAPKVTSEVRRFLKSMAAVAGRAAQKKKTPEERRQSAQHAARARWRRAAGAK